MSDQIICPHCGKSITLTEAISKQIQAEQEQRFLKQLAEQKQAFQIQLQEKEVQLKKEMWDKAQKAAQEKNAKENQELRNMLEDKDKKLQQMEEMEVSLRKQRTELEEAKRKIELEVVRKLDSERKAIQEKAEKEAEEKNRFIILEKEKQLEDTKKALLEAQRKAAQGSMQTQGEVLELDLEKSLKETFVHDRIEPVAKGVGGADIVHYVVTNTGLNCGIILWEVKQTKHWTEGWISKFKDDLRSQKANIPVLVSSVLPKGIDGFGLYHNVWVTEPRMALQLAIALRKSLLDAAYERSVAQGKGEKSQLLFDYVASHKFRQRVEALVEVYAEMQTQIIKERISFEKIWKQREGQMQRLFINTAGMYGEMQGLIGSAMPEIKGLELDNQKQIEDGKKSFESTLF